MQDVKRAVTRAGFFMGLVVAFVLCFSASCGSDDPVAATSDPGNQQPPTNDPCATPQKGCPCSTPGEKVKCGRTVHGEQNFVYCYEGTRTCGDDGRYGDCLDGVITARSIHPPLTSGATGVKPMAFGTNIECTAYNDGAGIDPCDPYCHVRHDDPIGIPLDGGFGLVDGGLAVVGSGDAGAVPTEVMTTGNGLSQCGGADNVVEPGACNTDPFRRCQQDHRCDPGSNTCVWNGGDGYFDPNAGGIDLTIGAGCTLGNVENIPLCNRGSEAVPPNTIVGINIVNRRVDACTEVFPTFECAVNVGDAGLPPGKCINVTGCPVAGNKNAVVNAIRGNGQPDVVEAPGRCANNGAAVKYAGAPGCSACQACQTTVTGTVYDPSGYSTTGTSANNLGLANISIFQPAGPLTPLTDNPSTGPTCDSCESLSSPVLTSTYSNPDGTFTLTGVTPGPNQTLVVQSGRWRRAFSVGEIKACQTNAIPAGVARLPRNRTDGLNNHADIPRIALVLGAAETLECFIRRIGISDSEFTVGATSYAAAIAKPQRFHVYRSNGWTMSGSPPSVSTLLSSNGPLDAYTAVIASCDGGSHFSGQWRNLSTANHQRLIDWTNKGGRFFTNHYVADALFREDAIAPWNSSQIVTHDTGDYGGAMSGNPRARVNNTTPPQQMLYQFLRAANAMTLYGEPLIELQDPRFQFYSAGPAAIEWIRGLETPTGATGWQTNPGGTHAMSISFETPLGAANTCGRVIFNGMHVSQARAPAYPTSTSHTFPNQCKNTTVRPSAEELALEFQLFQLTACALNPPPSTPAPVPAPLAVLTTYAVDFQGMCAPGERPVWQLFQYKAHVPQGTAIHFRAATADDPADLPGNPGLTNPPPGLPDTVHIGSAFDNNQFTNAEGWSYDSHGASPPAGFEPWDPRPISWHLSNDLNPGVSSKEYLRIYMTFQTNGNESPILYEWRQLFDCVAAE